MSIPSSEWEDQKPDLTEENADEIVQILDDLRLLVEHGAVEVGCDSIYKPDWDRVSIPSIVSFDVPIVGMRVSIGKDRGGSKSRKGEDGRWETTEYHAPVDIQVSIPVRVDFLDEARFINLWFDGQKGEHEARVLDAVIRLRTSYLKYVAWYFDAVDGEIPMLIQVAKMNLRSTAGSRIAFVAAMQEE